MSKSPPEGIRARPTPGNILEWHYVIQGPKGSPLPPTFPPEPAEAAADRHADAIRPLQAGRAPVPVHVGFHPETWNPVWSASTVLVGLLSFMLEDASTVGSITTSTETKRELAAQSLAHNATHSAKFRKLFPKLAQRGLAEAASRGLSGPRSGDGSRDGAAETARPSAGPSPASCYPSCSCRSSRGSLERASDARAKCSAETEDESQYNRPHGRPNGAFSVALPSPPDLSPLPLPR